MTQSTDTFTIKKKTVIYTATGIVGAFLVINVAGAFIGGHGNFGCGYGGFGGYGIDGHGGGAELQSFNMSMNADGERKMMMDIKVVLPNSDGVKDLNITMNEAERTVTIKGDLSEAEQILIKDRFGRGFGGPKIIFQ